MATSIFDGGLNIIGTNTDGVITIPGLIGSQGPTGPAGATGAAGSGATYSFNFDILSVASQMAGLYVINGRVNGTDSTPQVKEANQTFPFILSFDRQSSGGEIIITSSAETQLFPGLLATYSLPYGESNIALNLLVGSASAGIGVYGITFSASDGYSTQTRRILMSFDVRP